MILNWGNSNPSFIVSQHEMINKPDYVGTCSNKLKFFQMIHHARIPEWTDNYGVACGWSRQGHIVVTRKKLQGHGGEGIVINEPSEYSHNCLEEGKLYTKYKKKQREFRVHIFDHEVIHIQEKKKRNGEENVDWRIRNRAGGFVYCIKDIEAPHDVIVQAMIAYDESGLDFGAVDVIYNSRQGKAYVLEINTAPGLEGTTLDRYVSAIKRFCTRYNYEL